MTPHELLDLAREAAEKSYSPYSNFRVGAALVTEDGQVFTGANIENAAYPSSNCGEATALNTAAAAGARKVKAVAVACIDADDVENAYPCGRCRQVMSEFDVEDVYVTGGLGTEERSHTLDELLPHRFKM